MKEKERNATKSAVVAAGAMVFAYVAIEMGLKPFIHHVRHSFTKYKPPCPGPDNEVEEPEVETASKEREDRKQYEEESNEDVIAKQQGEDKKEEEENK